MIYQNILRSGVIVGKPLLFLSYSVHNLYCRLAIFDLDVMEYDCALVVH